MSRKIKKIAPVVIKVTVSNGQAKVNLPKHVALQLNLLNLEGEPGNVSYLLVTAYRRGVKLTPVEISKVDT